MREVISQRDTAEWIARFEREDVPAQVRLTPHQASLAPQIEARQMVVALDGERHIPFPVLADGARGAALRRTAPVLGADTEATLASLGFGPDEVAGLRSSGVLGGVA